MTTEQKMTDAPECVRQLASHQEQLDQDGVMVGVSRQALDETLEYITRLREQLQWRPISEAPRDGTLLQLIIEHGDADEDGDCDGGFENEHPHTRTMGFNNFDHDGEDRWYFPGWDWCQDEIIPQGCGKPVRWAPFLPLPPPPGG